MAIGELEWRIVLAYRIIILKSELKERRIMSELKERKMISSGKVTCAECGSESMGMYDVETASSPWRIRGTFLTLRYHCLECQVLHVEDYTSRHGGMMKSLSLEYGVKEEVENEL